MADDDLDEEFDPDAIEEELDEDALDDDAIDPDIEDDDAVLVVDAVDEDEVVEEVPARARKRVVEDEDDEEDVDPDDVEADLDTILKDRIAAADEDDDDEDDVIEPARPAEGPDGVVPKRANEFMCTGCFLLVNRGQFGPENDMQCPVGESECPAIDALRSPAKVVKPVKAVAKATKATRKR
jgi:hypothetical protein